MAPTAPEPAPRRTVVCLGDSHTRGFFGASWLALLRPAFPHLRFINAGRDGEPAEAIARRLPALLDAHPAPAAVILFAGSNDCIARESKSLQRWFLWWHWLSKPCSLQGALDGVRGMVQLVRQRAPDAKVIVINLPIMVEDPRHAANQRAAEYSRLLLQLVADEPGVAGVDFQAACRQHMAQHSAPWREQERQQQEQREQEQGPPAPGQLWQLSVTSAAFGMAWCTYVQRWLLGRSWADVSRRMGRVLLTDQIHINDTAAGLLADLLAPHLERL